MLGLSSTLTTLTLLSNATDWNGNELISDINSNERVKRKIGDESDINKRYLNYDFYDENDSHSDDDYESTTRRAVNQYWTSWFSQPFTKATSKEYPASYESYYDDEVYSNNNRRRFKLRKRFKPRSRRTRRRKKGYRRPSYWRKNILTSTTSATTTYRPESLKSPISNVYNSYQISLPGIDENNPEATLTSNEMFSPYYPGYRRKDSKLKSKAQPSSNVFVFNHAQPKSDEPSNNYWMKDWLQRMENLVYYSNEKSNEIDSRYDDYHYRNHKKQPKPLIKMPSFTPFLYTIPFIFGIGALVFTSGIQDDDSPIVNVNVNASSSSILNSNGSGNGGGGGGGGGTNSTNSILPIFIFPNGTVALPVLTGLLGLGGLTGISGLTGITGISGILGLINLLNILNIGRSFQDTNFENDNDDFISILKEPEYQDQISFNPSRPFTDLWDIGLIKWFRKTFEYWNDVVLFKERWKGRSIEPDIECYLNKICKLNQYEEQNYKNNSMLLFSKTLIGWWEEPISDGNFDSIVNTLKLSKVDQCDNESFC